MARYIQKISVDPASDKEWWVGWDLDDRIEEIPGLVRADAISEADLRAKGVTEFRSVSLPMLDRIERRRALRVHLDPPVRGMMGTVGVDIVDLSCGGAGIETRMPVAAGQKLVIDFEVRNEHYTMPFAVLRCSAVSTPEAGPVYYIALRHLEKEAVSRNSLRTLLARIAVRMLRDADADWGVYTSS